MTEIAAHAPGRARPRSRGDRVARRRASLCIRLAGVLLVAHASAGFAAERQLGYLTAPSNRPVAEIAAEIARDGLPSEQVRALAAAPPVEFELRRQFENATNGCTHLFFQQRVGGLDLVNADLAVTIDGRGRVLTLADRFVRSAEIESLSLLPTTDVRDAIREAALLLALEVTEPLVELDSQPGPERARSFSGGGIAAGRIETWLVVEDHPEYGLRLAWNLQFTESARSHSWSIDMDAHTGQLLRRVDAVRNESYRAFPSPLANPDAGERELIADPFSPMHSPDGWHRAGGASFSDTQGNNVVVSADLDGDNELTGGLRPDGGPALVFDFPLLPGVAPVDHLDASIANAFYWSNLAHDLFAAYGFDEAAGNYQRVNAGVEGFSGDPVLVDVQDGSGINNALFMGAADGSPGRMELFLWTTGGSTLEIEAPSPLAGDYPAGVAQFGPPLSGQGETFPVVAALDPVEGGGFSATDACSALTNPQAVAGKLALVDRGSCDFIVKVRNAEDAGAAGLIVANNRGDALVSMAPPDPSVGISSLFIGQTLGGQLRAEIASAADPLARLSGPTEANFIDSALDSTTILHEYAHGVTIRLAGGAQQPFCLFADQGAALGEGWSDFFALAFTSRESDSPFAARGFGSYLAGLPPTTAGIRNFPYSADLAINPQTYADISDTNQPHGAGEIWAAALWDLYWLLVQQYGFDTDLASGQGGNNLAIQLVLDGVAGLACEPTFLEARDAIVQADLARTGGQNECEIWTCFARRGLGFSASDDGGDPGSLLVSEAFDLPPGCDPVELLPEASSSTSLATGLAVLLGLVWRRRSAAR